MQAKGTILAMAALLAVVVAACAGGSGSSGFGISAVLENQAIDQALLDGTCQQGEGLTICPSGDSFGVPPGSETPGPDTAPPVAGPTVLTELGGATEQDCSAVSVSTECDFVVSISSSGFPPDAVFRVALRSSDPLSTWEIVGPLVDLDRLGLTTVIRVPSEALAIQIAVLVFAEPEAVTTDIALETLSASGADFAFVESPLGIAP